MTRNETNRRDGTGGSNQDTKGPFAPNSSASDKNTNPFAGTVVHYDVSRVSSRARELFAALPSVALRPWVTSTPNEQGEQRGDCPLHGDGTKDASFNFEKGVWSCYAGCEGGSLDALLLQIGQGDIPEPGTRKLRKSKEPEPLPSDATVAGWASRLQGSDAKGEREWLEHRRNISAGTLKRFEIGFDGGRITIPVRDHDGTIVNVRRRMPGAGQKVLGLAGQPAKRAWPLPEFIQEAADRPDAPLVIPEGELDAMVLWDCGFLALTCTGGAHQLANVMGDHLDLFEGRTVLIATDNDDPGDKARDALVALLDSVANVLILDHPKDAPDKFDISDLRRLLGRNFAERLENLIARGSREVNLESQIAAALGEMAESDQARDHTGGMLTEGQVHNLAPPEWLVDGYLPRVGVAVIYGQPGIGKTLELISITKSVQRGSRWHGREARQGSAVFYEGEGLAEFGPRWDAYNAKHAYDGSEAPAWFDSEDPVDLTSVRSLAAVVRTVRKQAEKSTYPVRLLVIEPLIENMTGDENAEGMDRASRGLRVLAKLLDCCVLVGHHTNASGERARGNDKLRARVQSMIRMEALGTASNARALVTEKQRNGVELAMELLLVEAEGSVVFQHVQEMSAEEFNRQRDARREQAKASKKAEVTEVQRQRIRELLLDAIAARPGSSQSAIVTECKGHGFGSTPLEHELQALRDDPGSVRVERVGSSYLHYPVESPEGGPERE